MTTMIQKGNFGLEKCGTDRYHFLHMGKKQDLNVYEKGFIVKVCNYTYYTDFLWDGDCFKVINEEEPIEVAIDLFRQYVYYHSK